ncbi:MAG: HPr family phosphocarrier protein [Planctomycetia bacterium]|jgi:phosphocarrier protein|nr:HPr family phosphocarrier protein [Planctomycetia bacterium]
MPSRKVTISNRLGLHARPAMLLAERASAFSSTIGIARADSSDPVDGKSIMQLLMLAGTAGTVLNITAEGDDAAAALASIAELIENGFEDDE